MSEATRLCDDQPTALDELDEPAPVLYLHIAQFDSIKDNVPEALHLSWQDLRKLLTVHTPRASKGGRLWSPTLYNDGTSRGKANVEQVSCFVMEFDCGMMPGPFRAEFKRWEHLIYSTHSHDPDYPKWRVVFPFREPVCAAEWEQVYNRLIHPLGKGYADPACKDASRIYYFPTCGLDATPFAEYHPGELLYPEAYPVRAEEPRDAVVRPVRERAAFKQGKGDYATLDAPAWFRAHGLYGGYLGGKKHHVGCPYEHEHTNPKERPEEDTDTVIFEGDGDRRFPQFFCSHAHCAHRSITDVIELWGDADRYCTREFETAPSIRFTIKKAAESDEGRDRLAECLERLQELLPKLKDDPGAIFTSPAKAAVAVLRRYDPENWARIKPQILKAKISLKDLYAALPPMRISALEAERTPDGDAPGLMATEPIESMLGDELGAKAAGLVVPWPYRLTPSQTLKVVMSDGDEVPVNIAYGPIVPLLRLRDEEENLEYFRVAYRRGGRWHEMTIDRGHAFNPRDLLKTASSGFVVTNSTAADVSEYFHTFEAANQATMPCARISAHLGPQGKGGIDGFLWGKNFIQPSGEMLGRIDPETLTADQWTALKGSIGFHGQDTGDDQLAEAFTSAGTMEDSIRNIGLLKDFPKLLVGVYATLVPSLLEIFQAPNFILDWSNRTTTGKTTGHRAMASVWGNPDEKSSTSLIGSWSNTRVYIERASAVLTGMPLFLDDSQSLKDRPQDIANVLYMVANGRGKGRGSQQGLARTRAWRTVLFSNGEHPVTNFTKDGGTRTRCLAIRGIPFGSDTTEMRQLANRLTLGAINNYGHIGPAFIQWLYSERRHWGLFAREYQKTAEKLAARADSPEGGRLAQYGAAIQVAAQMVHGALSLPWGYKDPLDTLWDNIVSEATDAAGELRALRDIISWAYANEGKFVGREHTSQFGQAYKPSEVAGRWNADSDWEYLAFYPHVLERELRAFGYEPTAIIAGWKARGWLQHDDKRDTKQVRIPGANPRMIVISRHPAFDEAEA